MQILTKLNARRSRTAQWKGVELKSLLLPAFLPPLVHLGPSPGTLLLQRAWLLHNIMQAAVVKIIVPNHPPLDGHVKSVKPPEGGGPAPTRRLLSLTAFCDPCELSNTKKNVIARSLRRNTRLEYHGPLRNHPRSQLVDG